MKNTKWWLTIFISALLFSSQFSFGDRAKAAENGNKVRPGEFVIDHPTLINLGF